MIAVNTGQSSGPVYVVGLNPDDPSVVQDYDFGFFGVHKVIKTMCFDRLGHFGIVAQLSQGGAPLGKSGVFVFSAKTGPDSALGRFVDYYELPFLLKDPS